MQLSFFAYSPLRGFLEAIAHCKTISKKAPIVSKKLPNTTVGKKAPL